MIGTIYISGIIGEDTTLLDVIKQVKGQSNATSFVVKIDSVGGFVDAGMDIHNYLKNLGKPISTFTTKAYSIASVIFMAGSVRIIPEGAEDALMIHLPWMEVAGSHNEIAAHLSELKAVEENLVKFYAEGLEIDKDTIQSLLQNETYLNATQAFDLGFATTVQPAQRAVARLNNTEEKESLMNKFQKKLDAIYNKLMGIKAELILQDATGLELVFPELEASDAPAADSKVTVDGKPADGEFLMPDGSTLVVTAGVVTEIKPVEAPVDAEGDSPEAPAEEANKDAIIAELEAKIAELEAKLAEKDTADDDAENMVKILEAAVNKTTELENKYQALAKQVGSDFTASSEKETVSATVHAKEGETPKFSIKRK